MIRVLIKLSLLFILVYAGVTIGYDQLEKELQFSTVVVQEQVVEPAEVKNQQQVLQKHSSYQIIVGRNIFEAVPELKKNQAKQQKPVPGVVEKAPVETQLKLILQGTVSSDREADGRAIIVDQKEKRQDLYQVGDAIQDALIVSIERGKVVLELNGKKQLLLLKDRQKGGGSTGSRRKTTRGFVPKTTISAPAAKSPFVMQSSRTAYSKNRSTAPPTAVPHRRISFRNNSLRGAGLATGDHEEPELPLVDEELDVE